jgi:hypothetical protein
MRAADDIPPRYEHKFLLTMAQAEEVRRIIAPFCTLDPFSAKAASRRYRVTSLYLDTSHFGCFRAWELAAPRRFKLRVRRYGEVLGESPIFLEVKERIEDTSIKRRTILTAEDWLERARYGGGRSAAEQDFCARRDRFRCAPVLLVRYEREAWKGTWDAYARVTFDAHIQYQACDRWTLMGDGGDWGASDDLVSVGEDDPRILLELKFERDVPRWLVGLMRNLELDRRGFSKYGVGIKQVFDPVLRLDPDNRESTTTEPF